MNSLHVWVQAPERKQKERSKLPIIFPYKKILSTFKGSNEFKYTFNESFLVHSKYDFGHAKQQLEADEMKLPDESHQVRVRLAFCCHIPQILREACQLQQAFLFLKLAFTLSGLQGLLAQALDPRRRASLTCYGLDIAVCPANFMTKPRPDRAITAQECKTSCYRLGASLASVLRLRIAFIPAESKVLKSGPKKKSSRKFEGSSVLSHWKRAMDLYQRMVEDCKLETARRLPHKAFGLEDPQACDGPTARTEKGPKSARRR